MSVASGPTRRERSPQVAEVVAAELRRRILDGELSDGDRLPRQEDLLAEFAISKPSLREALRILETEGLVSVRRGKVGGAVVHRPSTDSAAYALGMVLRSNGVDDSDIAAALNTIEPQCAALCARREDRHDAVVPALRVAHAQASAAVDDVLEFAAHSWRFHEQLVAGCGNETLILLVGALEAVRSEFIEAWVHDHEPPMHTRRQALEDHARIIELIEDGDAEGVAEETLRHLAWSAIPLRPTAS